MTMLRSNLATKPFYNERLIHALVGAAAILVLAFTAFNVSEYLRLSGRPGGPAAQPAREAPGLGGVVRRAPEPEGSGGAATPV
ncbi:MAG: hypothetical protein ACHQRO_11475 [Vicinamibacteria bacterium]